MRGDILKSLFRFGIIIACFFFIFISIAQDNQITVPDLTGLNMPQAAARLNEIGLGLGTQTPIVDATQAEGLIGEQSIVAGEMVETGSTIDVGIYRNPNMILIYDDNDFTLVNTTQNIADVTGLRFVAVEGSNPASFAATRWTSNVSNGRCLQVWSISRRDPKSHEECESIQNWLTTNDTGEHFWTQTNAVQQFAVIEDGIERANCGAADSGTQDSPLRCSFYLAGASSAENLTPFLYFVYTTDAITIINQTDDQWMPTDRTNIINNNPNIQNPGVSLIMGDPELFQNPDIVADISRLAPKQCIMLSSDNPQGVEPAQPCNLIAQRDLSSSVAFWLADFEVESATDGQNHTCPAAKENVPTLCIVPQ